MAGVKVTDLNALGSADANDVFYIVDTSANESKKIQVGDVLSSGEYNPTFSNEFGAITSVTTTRNYYQKIGNIVTCSINITMAVDFSSTDQGEVEFTLPFATISTEFGGVLSSFNITNQFNGSIKQNKLVITSEDTSLVGTFNFTGIFQYLIA